MVSMPTFLTGIFSVLAVYNWASLCTNRCIAVTTNLSRHYVINASGHLHQDKIFDKVSSPLLLTHHSDLFLGLLRIYIGALFYLLTTSIWCFVALLLTFEKKIWKVNSTRIKFERIRLASKVISINNEINPYYFLFDRVIWRSCLPFRAT